ncbi:MAG: hypothetical protein HY961_17555 [Ignavibacteriae bacterium]|nr:hypothetical protein [Ignavibacteriota bacterium]
MFKLCCALLSCVIIAGCAKPNDPESLTQSSGGYAVVSKLATSAYAQDVEVKDSLAYIVQGEGGLLIVNVADRARPRIVASCQEGVRGYSYKLALKDSIVYVAAATFGVNVVNVRNPLSPVAVASNIAIKPAKSFSVFGDYLFTSISESGVKIADITVPSQPDIRGGIQNPGYAQALTTTQDSAYLLVACGEMGVALFDVRDMQGGFGYYPQVGWTDLPGYAVDVATMGNRPIALVACGRGGVQVVDFSDTAHVRVIGSYATGGYAKEIAYRNNRVYVTTELRGLQILSVDDPSSPKLIGVIDTEFALGLAVDQKYVYVADEEEGLIIISIPSY